MARNRFGNFLSAVPAHAFLWLVLFLTLFPFGLMVIRSFKNLEQIIQTGIWPQLPLHYGNYIDAWNRINMFLLNSAYVAILSVAGAILFSSLTAYVFGRYDFPGKQPLFYALLALLMIPGILALIPRYVLVVQLGLMNSLWALIFNSWSHQVFSVFVLRTFVESLPEELFEAARLDGAGHLRLFASLVVPLSKPVIGVLTILSLLGSWNEYIWPLLVLRGRTKMTIPLGLVDIQRGVMPEPGIMMAGYVIASIPLLLMFIFTMRTFIAGLTSGAIKG